MLQAVELHGRRIQQPRLLRQRVPSSLSPRLPSWLPRHLPMSSLLLRERMRRRRIPWSRAVNPVTKPKQSPRRGKEKRGEQSPDQPPASVSVSVASPGTTWSHSKLAHERLRPNSWGLHVPLRHVCHWHRPA